MKKSISILLLLLVSYTTMAQEEKIVGEWKTDFISFKEHKVSGGDKKAQNNIKKWLIAKKWPISNKDKTSQENINSAISQIESLEEFYATFIFRSDLTVEIISTDGILGQFKFNGTYTYKNNELTIKIIDNPNPLLYPVIKIIDNTLIIKDIETDFLLHYKK